MFSSQVAEMNSAREAARLSLTQLKLVAEFVADYRDPQERRFDDAGLIAGQIYSLREAIAHAERALRMFLTINIDKNKPLPSLWWQPAKQAVTELREAAADLGAQMTTAKTDGNVLSIANGSVIAVKDTGQVITNFTAGAVKLVSSGDTLAAQSTMLIALSKASLLAKNDQEAVAIADDASASALALTKSEQSAKEASEAANRVREAQSALEEARAADQAQVAGIVAEFEKNQAETAKILQQIQADAKTISDQVVAANARITDASNVKSQAEEINRQISSYNSTLDTTKQRVKDVENTANKVVALMEDQHESVEKLIHDAEDMLRGSTVAGLATTFSVERSSLERSMTGAIVGFGIGIVLLTAMSIALAAYVLNMPFTIFGFDITHLNPNKRDFEPSVAGVISRAIILLGPFWLTLFSARRYARLFDLRQRYSHKYNMAMSVEGFKKQAPAYAEAISAWVFQIVAENPVPQRAATPMEDAPAVAFKDIGSSLMEQVGKLFGGGA